MVMAESSEKSYRNNREGGVGPEMPPQPPQPRSYRLAVFGGSFDPVHQGHLNLAAQVVSQALADEVMFVPALFPPHKPERLSAAAADRLAMLQLALEGQAPFSCSDIELQRGGTASYTIDTMSVLSKVYPDCELYFLLGMDSLESLHTWHRAGELVQRFNFIVYPRPGVVVPSLRALDEHFGPRSARKLTAAIVTGEDLPLWDISSSQLRQLCAASADTAGLLPDRVREYIDARALYRHVNQENT